MYIRLSADISVRSGDIVGIFDFDNCTTGKRTLPLLKRAQSDGFVESNPYELPRSFALCGGRGSPERLILTGNTTATIKKRLDEGGISWSEPELSTDGR